MAAMTSSILDSLTRSLGSTAYTQAANTYGESDPAVTKGFTVAVAAVLAPLVARAGNMQFMRGLLEMTREVPADVTLLDEPERLFNRAPRALEETGPVALLRSLVFGGNPETINNGISRASGVKPATAAAFFSIALPTVLGYLSRLVSRENLDAPGLGRRLAAERAPLAAVLPSHLGSLLTSPDAPVVSPARDPDQARASVPAAGLSQGASSNKWLAAAIVVLLAVIGLYAIFGRGGRTIEGTPGAVGTAGYIDRVLPDGTNLRFPAESTEARFLAFLEGGTTVDRETWYEFDRITFETDSATLRPQSREQLANMAAILKAFPSARVKIGGYTDNSGDAGENLKLSQSRAETVMHQLRDMGVAANRLDAEGYGNQHPIASNSTADGRARNRRVALRATQK
jgi:outer membrane protein OmpA-like peptidoglycan-associated protein